MSSGLRERKKGTDAKNEKTQTPEEEDTKKQQEELGPVDLEPDFKVVLALVLAFASLIGIFVYYKIDGRDNGPFATWVNTNIIDPIVPPLKRWFVPQNRYQKKGL